MNTAVSLNISGSALIGDQSSPVTPKIYQKSLRIPIVMHSKSNFLLGFFSCHQDSLVTIVMWEQETTCSIKQQALTEVCLAFYLKIANAGVVLVLLCAVEITLPNRAIPAKANSLKTPGKTFSLPWGCRAGFSCCWRLQQIHRVFGTDIFSHRHSSCVKAVSHTFGSHFRLVSVPGACQIQNWRQNPKNNHRLTNL